MSKRRLVVGFLAFLSLTASARTVERVGIVARPRGYNGACPATLEFIATIFVNRYPTVAEYQWERSDGAVSGRRRVNIRSRGQGVRENWTLGRGRQSLHVWERLHVLAPTNILSPVAPVTVNCR